MDKTRLLINYRQEISEEEEDWLNKALSQRKQGLPVAYITGQKEFYGYEFLVSPSVLIPKADTEILRVAFRFCIHELKATFFTKL